MKKTVYLTTALLMAFSFAALPAQPTWAQEKTVDRSTESGASSVVKTQGVYNNINSAVATAQTTITTLRNKIDEVKQRLDNAANSNCPSGQYVIGMNSNNTVRCGATPAWVSISPGECGGACTAANTWSRPNYYNGAADSLCQRHGKSQSIQYRTESGGYTSGSFCWWAGGTQWNCDGSCSSCFGLPRYTSVLCQ